MKIIDTNQGLESLAQRLSRNFLVAADTEAAGYHRYEDRVCLLQLTSGGDTYIVDTLAVDGLEPLRGIFEDPDIEVVFHDADYDLRLLHRDYAMAIEGLFDTKVAAQFIGDEQFGLQNLLENHLGVEVEKKYQRADWARRPLPIEMLDYAAEDTRYLPALRDRLKDRLEKAGRLHWAEEEFRIIEGTRWEDDDGEAAFLQLRGVRDLDRRQLGALRELHAWREEEGQRRDVATFRVLSKEALVEIAARMPTSEGALSPVKGVSSSVISRYGSALLQAVERARALPEDELPEHPPRPPRRPRPSADFEERVDRLKNARDQAAKRLGLDRGFLMARWQLLEVAEAEPATMAELLSIGSVRDWQGEALGAELLAAL